MSQVENTSPARPQSLKVAFVRTGERLELKSRSTQWATGCFMALWLIGWTVGCVFLAGMVIRDPQLFHILFAIPFWASWVFVFLALVNTLVQREQLVLDHQGATFHSQGFVLRGQKFTPLGEVRSFEITSKVVDSESGRTRPQMEMQTLGYGQQFLLGVGLQELQWLRWQLTEHLDLLKRAVAYATAGENPAVESSAPPPLAPGQSQPLVLGPLPVVPPSDSQWMYANEIESFRFLQHGRLSLSAVGGLLFLNLFWNGIVAVFVSSLFGLAPGGAAPAGAEWWGLFFFLIPFEAIGITMLAGLLASMLEPVRRSTWTITRQSIEFRWAWLGIGPKWIYAVDRLARIEIRRDDPSDRKTVRGSMTTFAASGGDVAASYRLLFIDRGNVEICSIKRLTEGEARWMGDIVLRNREAWF